MGPYLKLGSTPDPGCLLVANEGLAWIPEPKKCNNPGGDEPASWVGGRPNLQILLGGSSHLVSDQLRELQTTNN